MPPEVLAQLGNRVQHALRVFTPQDAKALSSTVSTFPKSKTYALDELLPSLGIGEAVVTVLSETGAPTPVAWTRLRAPESLMAATDPAAVEAAVKASPSYATYATAVDRPSAAEALETKMTAARSAAQAEAEAKAAAKQDKADRAQSRSRPKAATGLAASQPFFLDRAITMMS